MRKLFAQATLTSMASSASRIGKVAMMERIGAKLTNARWGWDAEKSDGSIVFIVFVDGDSQVGRSPTGEGDSYEISRDGSSKNDELGGRERGRHVEQLLETGAAAYLVIAKPKDPNVHPHEIDGFEPFEYTVHLERHGDTVYARVVSRRSIP